MTTLIIVAAALIVGILAGAFIGRKHSAQVDAAAKAAETVTTKL